MSVTPISVEVTRVKVGVEGKLNVCVLPLEPMENRLPPVDVANICVVAVRPFKEVMPVASVSQDKPHVPVDDAVSTLPFAPTVKTHQLEPPPAMRFPVEVESERILPSADDVLLVM